LGGAGLRRRPRRNRAPPGTRGHARLTRAREERRHVSGRLLPCVAWNLATDASSG
jgi:hypothetical protein